MTEYSAAAAAGDVSDDVSSAMTSPSRAVDFSINSLLSSASVGRRRACRSQLQQLVNYDSSLGHRVAAAALWYPWLHSVASLQSTDTNHHLGKQLSISTLFYARYVRCKFL